MLSVTVRAVVSAESLTLIVLKLGGFWRFTAARMPCTLPALPTLTVSVPEPITLMAMWAEVLRMLTVLLPLPVLTTNGEGGLK